MDVKIAVRVLAVLAFGAAMTACVVALRLDDTEEAPTRRDQPRAEKSTSSELIRCRDIGVAALDDVGCRKAWAENCRRFLEGDRSSRSLAQTPEKRFDVPGISGAPQP